MPKKHEPDARLSDMRQAFLEQAAELWDKHEDGFMRVLEESEIKKVKVTYGVTLDFTESSATLETAIAYSQVMKDKRTTEFDDPNQLGMEFQRNADNGAHYEHGHEEPAAPKRRGRKKEQEAEPSGDSEAE